MQTETDQRRYIRHPTGISIRVYSGSGDRLELRPVANVSFGGVCFQADAGGARHEDALMRPDRLAAVAVEFPELPGIPRLAGRVAWCRAGREGFDVGIQFDDADEAFRARMVEQVCHITRYRRQVFDYEGRRLTEDEAAREWIARYGASFPQFPEQPTLQVS